MTDPLARARLEKLAALHEDAARRFAGYHATSLANDEPSVWDARSLEEFQVAADLRSLLADSLPREGERERIARIIDPWSWESRDHYLNAMSASRDQPGGATSEAIDELANWKVMASLAKADQIMGREDG